MPPLPLNWQLPYPSALLFSQQTPLRRWGSGASPDAAFAHLRRFLTSGAGKCFVMRGASAVHIASAMGHVDVVRVLGELGADVNAATQDGSTPALVAVEAGDVEMVRVLGKLGANLRC